VVSARVDGLDSEGLRAVADTIRDRLGSGVVLVGGVADTKVSLVAAVTKDLTKRYHAGKLIQAVAQVVGGGGGGRPDLAQAGGKDPARLDEALDLVYELIAGR
jgi:alanyl-tRNA synthetase